MTADAALDVLVAARDPARLDELTRTVFSIALQDHRPVTIHVVCGGFASAQLEAVRRALGPLMTVAGDAGLEIVTRPAHAGLRARYAAFIDCGALVYPEGYRLLIAELVASGAAIAFGGILDATVCRDGLVPVTTEKRRGVPAGVVQPLHSFVLDRHRIAAEDLALQELTVEHSGNVEFLRRLCTRYPGSFRLRDKIVGERVLSGTT